MVLCIMPSITNGAEGAGSLFPYLLYRGWFCLLCLYWKCWNFIKEFQKLLTGLWQWVLFITGIFWKESPDRETYRWGSIQTPESTGIPKYISTHLPWMGISRQKNKNKIKLYTSCWGYQFFFQLTPWISNRFYHYPPEFPLISSRRILFSKNPFRFCFLATLFIRSVSKGGAKHIDCCILRYLFRLIRYFSN